MSCLTCGGWGEACCANQTCNDASLECNQFNICQNAKGQGPQSNYGYPCVDRSQCALNLECVTDKVTTNKGPFTRCGCPENLPQGGQSCNLWNKTGEIGICGDSGTTQSWDALTHP